LTRGQQIVTIVYAALLILTLTYRPYESPGGLLGPAVEYRIVSAPASADREESKPEGRILLVQQGCLFLIAANLWLLVRRRTHRSLPVWLLVLLIVYMFAGAVLWPIYAGTGRLPFIIEPFVAHILFIVLCGPLTISLIVLLVKGRWPHA
jgi:hypothetical protein